MVSKDITAGGAARGLDNGLAGGLDNGLAGGLGGVLEAVRRSAALLLSECDERPKTLVLRAGEVTLELAWPDAPSAGPVPGPTPVPAQSTPASPPGDAAGDPSDAGLEYLCAPTVGVFYRAPEPGAEPFVAEGELVTAGQQVGIVEAMKLLIPVEADRTGRVAEVLKADATPVEYGERLFALRPAGSP